MNRINSLSCCLVAMLAKRRNLVQKAWSLQMIWYLSWVGGRRFTESRQPKLIYEGRKIVLNLILNPASRSVCSVCRINRLHDSPVVSYKEWIWKKWLSATEGFPWATGTSFVLLHFVCVCVHIFVCPFPCCLRELYVSGRWYGYFSAAP